MPDSTEALSPTKRALVAIKELQAKLDALEQAQTEPIALIGMGCRLPGGIASPDQYWDFLQAGRNGITEVPPDRWNPDDYQSTDPSQPGCPRMGGFVPHLWDFDAPFFRIAPREALTLDPQQRLLLEVSWEALEHGAIAPDALNGTATGVYVGICGIDYWHQLLSQHPDTIDAYLSTGNSHSVAAGRLSYLLGLTGPSLAVDTACSSSLVSVHLACQSLRQRDCDLALAGGVNRILLPQPSLNFARARMLSPDGACRSFDAAANGFVRAEGCGVVVLKRLRDAERDGDRIDAIILGSAVNHDGRTSGLTVPHGPAQQALIQQALRNSQVLPEAVSYLEAHGTGTALGDPIEVNALGAVFGTSRTDANPLILGSVKSNIGHLEAASGIAGLIKVVLALQHQQIPGNLHFQTPNPHIPWADLPLRVAATSQPWEPKGDRRIAGVSAFGFNGTNAHVILADPPAEMAIAPTPQEASSPQPGVLVLSARSEEALRQLAERYYHHLTAQPSTGLADGLADPAMRLADLYATAATGRSHFPYRCAIVAQTLGELQQHLAAFLNQTAHPHILQGRTTPNPPPQPPLTPAPTLNDWLTLAQSYVAGSPIPWQDHYPRHLHRPVPLPTYPFQRQPYRVTLPR